jgi:hypothetical protein
MLSDRGIRLWMAHGVVWMAFCGYTYSRLVMQALRTFFTINGLNSIMSHWYLLSAMMEQFLSTGTIIQI